MTRAENINYPKIVLGVVVIAGIIAIGAIAPNAVQLLDLLPNQGNKKKSYINKIVIKKLIDKKLVKIITDEKGRKGIKLTKLGKEKLKEYKLTELTIKKPRRWDKKYRLIIFDIKEWKRDKRDKIRRWLEKLGFIRLQNSVWVYPYDCEEVIALLKANYQIGKEVLYIEADNIENDYWLKKSFDLI
ncbi:MAG: hypothetical protein UY51_C0003G0008 [Candidatus Jorgensenbacteria bacterium GW2011_GWB1_49_9]|uniref:CRISPR-associated endonuclease Cas2 n=1 Tax=Candidatus Vogelbacteria bacterium GWA1_51_14 TaxID=1802435 RepID=A0A1G2Q8A2_9BACT|nr:MAG: hypothetical protein UY51_C0003G0008 [Candidatus Jorgensenbacteria bacterium GW2011_GWB1_49_9]OHA56783.1 MAG: CRISPR-associated endonuclease Cas2 [Candidatus Vogelbacteria bacterium GWA1_51_14]